MTLDKKAEGFLSQMLEGFEEQYKQVNQYITEAEPQIEGAKQARAQVEEKIAELKDLLGLDDETDETKAQAESVDVENSEVAPV